MYDDFGNRTLATGPNGTSITTYSAIYDSADTAVGKIGLRTKVSVDSAGTSGTHVGRA